MNFDKITPKSKTITPHQEEAEPTLSENSVISELKESPPFSVLSTHTEDQGDEPINHDSPLPSLLVVSAADDTSQTDSDELFNSPTPNEDKTDIPEEAKESLEGLSDQKESVLSPEKENVLQTLPEEDQSQPVEEKEAPLIQFDQKQVEPLTDTSTDNFLTPIRLSNELPETSQKHTPLAGDVQTQSEKTTNELQTIEELEEKIKSVQTSPEANETIVLPSEHKSGFLKVILILIPLFFVASLITALALTYLPLNKSDNLEAYPVQPNNTQAEQATKQDQVTATTKETETSEAQELPAIDLKALIATAGAENIYGQDLETYLNSYFYSEKINPSQRQAAIEKAVEALIDESLMLQDAQKRGFITLPPAAFNLPDKNQTTRNQLVATAKQKINNALISHLSGEAVYMYFDNTPSWPAPEMGLTAAKQVTSKKMQEILTSIKTNGITLTQAAEKIKADTSLNEIDPSYKVNAYYQFKDKTMQESIFKDEKVNSLVWGLDEGESTEVLTAKEDGKEFAYMIAKVTKKVKGEYESFSDYLLTLRKHYDIKKN